jgi:hypothetical protein
MELFIGLKPPKLYAKKNLFSLEVDFLRTRFSEGRLTNRNTDGRYNRKYQS